MYPLLDKIELNNKDAVTGKWKIQLPGESYPFADREFNDKSFLSHCI